MTLRVRVPPADIMSASESALGALIESTLRKLEGALDRAEGFLSSRPAQEDSRAAAEQLIHLLMTQRDEIAALAPLVEVGDREVIATRCDVALAKLVRWTPLLGLIHRSKSSANPFEMYGPLLALARQVIAPHIRLVVSSEWDFSPFTMPHGTALDGFVFVGMPAIVPDKSLVMPLAGHEFGHSIWLVRNAEDALQPIVFQAVWDRLRARVADVIAALSPYGIRDEAGLQTLEGLRAWRRAYLWALQQAQELFCDLCGLRLFGAAYAHAFAYLLAPGLVDHRIPSYPHPRSRADVLVQAAARWDVPMPGYFLDAFTTKGPIESSPGALLGEIADSAALDLVDKLIGEVEAHALERGVALPRAAAIDGVRADFALVVPSDRAATLPEILCAGWQVRTDAGIWASLPHIRAEGHRVLDDLILKSAQMIEYHQRIQAATA